MKRIIIAILFCMAMASGCKQEKEIIPREDMVSVLVKIHLMDRAMQIAQYNQNVAIPDTLDVYEVVLEDYGYTRAQFDSSIQYYSKDLKNFDRIYQEVLTRLNEMETAAQEQRGQNQGRQRETGLSGEAEKRPPPEE